MRHSKLKQPTLHSVEIGFIVDAQGDGMRPLGQPSWGTLAGSVDELRRKNTSREIASNNTKMR